MDSGAFAQQASILARFHPRGRNLQAANPSGADQIDISFWFAHGAYVLHHVTQKAMS
jgi:hypothetical protein